MPKWLPMAMIWDLAEHIQHYRLLQEHAYRPVRRVRCGGGSKIQKAELFTQTWTKYNSLWISPYANSILDIVDYKHEQWRMHDY